MMRSKKPQGSSFGIRRRIQSAAVMLVMVTLTLVSGAFAQGHFKVLYAFNGGKNDGGSPFAGLTADAAGNFYGTTLWGGQGVRGCGGNVVGCGTVFKLTPNLDGSWSESVLYTFSGGNDGGFPYSGVIFDAAGNLYGTTASGGTYGSGTAFQLHPNPDGSWSESVLYSFTYGNDGGSPLAGLIFDAAGNLYGTTEGGGSYKAGTVFKLTPNPDGSWSESVLYSFTHGNDGAGPYAGVIFDAAGNLYGTTPARGRGAGTVFQLTPNPDGSWTPYVLHQFSGGEDGSQPLAGLIIDAAGNLYGTTPSGGAHSGGTVFQLRPNLDGSWTEHVLHAFTAGNMDGFAPYANLIFDAAGCLYGTTGMGGLGYGTAFQLKPNPDGSWTEHILHRFTGSQGGTGPYAGLIFDAAGNLYGTTYQGGNYGYGRGTVFELTP